MPSAAARRWAGFSERTLSSLAWRRVPAPTTCMLARMLACVLALQDDCVHPTTTPTTPHVGVGGCNPAGLIGTSVYVPAADPSSPRIAQPTAAAEATGAPAAAPSPFGWPAMSSGDATGMPADAAQPLQPTHARSNTVVVRPAPKGGKAAAAVPVPAQGAPAQAPVSPPALSPAGRSSDYLAALDRQGKPCRGGRSLAAAA